MHRYEHVSTLLEKLLRKYTPFIWTEQCQKAFDELKEKSVTTALLVFPNWTKEFHVHVDASSIVLGIVLAQLGEGKIGHPIAFSIRKFSLRERYTATKREGIVMVYYMQKYKHYLLGSHFKLYRDHFSLKYLVNKLVLGGIICCWLFLFQEYDFEVIVKPRKENVGLDHLS